MTYSTIRQIERARHATRLLRAGVSIPDAVDEAGYYDQAHLTRSLKRLIGQTPAQVLRGEKQLSFLYKTSPPESVKVLVVFDMEAIMTTATHHASPSTTTRPASGPNACS